MRTQLTWLLLLCLSIQSGLTPFARAHGDAPATGVLANQTVKALQEHIEKSLAQSRRMGVDVPTEAEEKAGELLLAAVFNEVVEEQRDLKPSLKQEVFEHVKALGRHLNPVTMGKWLLDMARREGPAIAIIYGVSEVVEKVGVLLAAKYPFFLFMIPLEVSHANDVLVFALGFGLPHAIRLAHLWSRFGGVLKGPAAYYEHLLDQRRALPIDWSEVVDVDGVMADLGTGTPEEVQIAIINENFAERHLPRGMRIALSPRKVAQRDSVPTFSIFELEQLAKKNGIDLKPFRGFKAHAQLYANMLIHEVTLNHDAALAFTSEVRVRNEKASIGGVAKDGNAWTHATVIDAEELVKVASIEELQRRGRDADETPDLLAQRAVWYLRDQREALYLRTKVSKAEAGPEADLQTARKTLRSLGKLLESDNGLNKVATSRFESPSGADWKTLFDELNAAETLLDKVRAAVPAGHTPEQDSRCEKLLTAA